MHETQTPVSVIIPTFNCGTLVVDAVKSALFQTLKPQEVIVVDDGSSDDTAERLAQYRDAIRYVRQENKGVAAARNKGIASAGGEFLAFLDADDVWHPRKLELQMRELGRRENLAMLGTGRFSWPRDELPEISDGPEKEIRIIEWKTLVVRNLFTTSSVVVRRRVIDEIGTFDPALQGPEDHDLWIRIAERHAVANMSGIQLVGYRDAQGSLSKQTKRMRQGMTLILRKVESRTSWRGDRLLKRRAYSYLHASCALMFRDAGDLTGMISSIVRSIAWHPLPLSRSDFGLSRTAIGVAGLMHAIRGRKR